MKIDPSKKYKTSNGWEVIIHSTDGPFEKYPIVASVRSGVDDDWQLAYWDESDLVEVREPREWKAIVLRGGTLAMYSEGDEARWGIEVVRVREIIEP